MYVDLGVVQLAAAWVRYREFYAEVLQQREALMGAMLKWLKKVTAAT